MNEDTFLKRMAKPLKDKTPEQILEEHHYFSANIKKIVNFQKYLIVQIQEQKFVCEAGISSPSSDVVNQIYHLLQFTNKKDGSGFIIWSYMFKEIMESVLRQEMMIFGQRPENSGDVYFNVGLKNNVFYERQKKVIGVDLRRWSLEHCPEMTPADISVIKNFIELFTQLITIFRSRSVLTDDSILLKRALKETTRLDEILKSLSAVLE